MLGFAPSAFLAGITKPITRVVSAAIVAEPTQRLAAIDPIDALRSRRPAAPKIPLGQSDLLVNARDEPRIGAVLPDFEMFVRGRDELVARRTRRIRRLCHHEPAH